MTRELVDESAHAFLLSLSAGAIPELKRHQRAERRLSRKKQLGNAGTDFVVSLFRQLLQIGFGLLAAINDLEVCEVDAKLPGHRGVRR